MTSHASRAPRVRHYVAGGTEHGGGIGRLVGYVCATGDTTFRHIPVDTRGPRWNRLTSPFRLLGSLAVMTGDTLRGSGRLQQLHIAGRGSTARKIILGGWARILGLPYILHLHDYDYAADVTRRPDWQQRLIRGLFAGAIQVIVLGKRDRETVAGLLEVPRERITVLRNCVPDPGPRRVHPEDPVRLLFLGQLGPRKGVPDLIEALADPAMPRFGWQAVLAGDGPVESYREEVVRRGLGDRVTLTGWLDTQAAAELREKADILVLPSHGEGFAMAVLEGLASGLAVVTTAVGAHGEVLRDGENCLLVIPGDAKGLARAMARLVAQEDLRSRIGAAGRSLYLNEFRLDGYVEAIEALHAKLLNAATAAPRSA